jgi:hypothetical protein
MWIQIKKSEVEFIKPDNERTLCIPSTYKKSKCNECREINFASHKKPMKVCNTMKKLIPIAVG